MPATIPRAVNVWSKFPYGVRLPEDPTAMFETLIQQEMFAMGAWSGDTGANTFANEGSFDSRRKDNLLGWFKTLRMNPNESMDAIVGAEGLNESGSPWIPPDKGGEELSYYTMPNYTDTRVGGNDAINPYWQFNRDDDIVPNMLQIKGVSNTTEDYGMGRLYSERYNDNQQILWLSMGVAEYTNLISFYLDAGDNKAATAMRRGTVAGLFGTVIGTIVKGTIWAFTFPIHAGMWFYKWIRRSDMTRVTRYYWFNPSTTLYLEMVNSMLSYLAVGMGLYPTLLQRVDSSKDLTGKTPAYDPIIDGWSPGSDVKYNVEDTGIPEILKDGPDIFIIMDRRSRLFQANRARVTTRQLLQATNWPEDEGGTKNQINKDHKKYFTSEHGMYEHIETKAKNEEGQEYTDEIKWKKIEPESDKAPHNFFSSFRETMFGAGDHVGFRIERSSNASESVSNETGQTAIAQTLNNAMEQQKEEYESSMGGNLFARILHNWQSKGGLEAGLGATLKGVGMRGVANLASTFGLGDLGAIIANGNGFLNMPDVWKNSSFTKNYSFSIELQSRYGDPVSIYQSIYIPLVMLLAASLPRSIGSSAYTSPFLVKAYCKGQFAIPCGIVSSLDITRGKEEHGWSNVMLPTYVSVSLSLKDLTPAMFLGMGNIGLFDTFSRNEAMHEYLDTLSALGISERKYLMPQFIRKASAALLVKKNTMFSSTYWGARLGRSSLARAYANLIPFGNNETTDMKYNASKWKLANW